MVRETPPVALLLLLALACRSPETVPPEPDPIPDTVPEGDPWSSRFEPPALFETERLRLEPLAPRHVELDFAALMGSREHLRRTLRWGDWPRDDFTVGENRGDLERHWGEFERREAYAYTVLTPDGSRCIGCIYLNPIRHADLPDEERDGMLAFWVVEDELENDLDRHLAESLVAWFEERWPLDMVFFLPHADDDRGAEMLAGVGLAELDPIRPEHRTFVWERR